MPHPRWAPGAHRQRTRRGGCTGPPPTDGMPPSAGGGGYAALTVVAPDVEVQTVRGHLRASVGVLLSFHGVDQPRAGVPRAGGVEEEDQGVAPP